jgi:branched-chain amino acid transport system substrate-binding protein
MSTEAMWTRVGIVCAFALLASLAAGCGAGQRDTIRIGIYGDCYSPLAGFTVQADAGADVAFIRHGARPNGPTPSDGVSAITVAGRRVELLFGCDLYRSHTGSLAAARRLVEQQGADIVVIPNSVPDDSVASLYAPHQRGVAFISAGLDPAARLGTNVFRISPDNRQLSAGLGAYAFHTLGWRTAVTVGEGDAQGFGQTAGFVAEFCSLGGTIVRRFWGTAGTKDWSGVVRQIPRGVDGVALMTALASTKSFFAAYGKLHADVQRRVVMNGEPLALGDRPPPGVMVSGAPFEWSDPAYRDYRAAAHAAFPRYRGGIGEPQDIDDYDSIELALETIKRVDGDMSDGDKRFMAALSSVRLRSPFGTVRIDRSRHAVVPGFLSRVERGPTGAFVVRTVQTLPGVDSTFGGYFTPASPRDSRTQPVCRKGHVPPWAR